MKYEKHKVIKQNLSTGIFGPASAVDCTFLFIGFHNKAGENSDETYAEMTKEFVKIFLEGEHPTMNPIMDEFLKEDTNDFEEAVLSYIKREATTDIQPLDNDNDVLEIKVVMRLMAVNVLPFLKQDKIKLSSAMARSALFSKELGDPNWTEKK